jgi:hypothetical protein
MADYIISKNKKPKWSGMLQHLVSSPIFTSQLHYGVIEKPRDTKTDKNMWRAFKGFGLGIEFIGHFPTKAKAARAVFDNRRGQ